MDLAVIMFILSHTIIGTSSKLLSVSIGVTRFTELRPLLTSTFVLQKKIVTSRILPFVFNEMCGWIWFPNGCTYIQATYVIISNTFIIYLFRITKIKIHTVTYLCRPRKEVWIYLLLLRNTILDEDGWSETRCTCFTAW